MNTQSTDTNNSRKTDICGKPHAFYEGIPLSEEGFPEHSVNCLADAGITTVADFFDTPVQDLLMVQGLAPDELAELLGELEKKYINPASSAE